MHCLRWGGAKPTVAHPLARSPNTGGREPLHLLAPSRSWLGALRRLGAGGRVARPPPSGLGLLPGRGTWRTIASRRPARTWQPGRCLAPRLSTHICTRRGLAGTGPPPGPSSDPGTKARCPGWARRRGPQASPGLRRACRRRSRPQGAAAASSPGPPRFSGGPALRLCA